MIEGTWCLLVSASVLSIRGGWCAILGLRKWLNMNSFPREDMVAYRAKSILTFKQDFL